MFNLAELWGLRPDGSDTRGLIQKYPEVKPERFLSLDEIKHLGDVLREVEQDGHEIPSAILAIRLLLYTGCRLTDLQPFWQRVHARAGLSEVLIHDPRHTFASTATVALKISRPAERPSAEIRWAIQKGTDEQASQR